MHAGFLSLRIQIWPGRLLKGRPWIWFLHLEVIQSTLRVEQPINFPISVNETWLGNTALRDIHAQALSLLYLYYKSTAKLHAFLLKANFCILRCNYF